MAEITLVPTWMTSNMDLVFSPGQMGKNSLDNGKMENKTAKENIKIPKVKSDMASGKKVKNKNGSQKKNTKNSKNEFKK